MKVISQLARHFWSRGVLTPEQAEYLVSQGFVRAHDLRDFHQERRSAWDSGRMGDASGEHGRETTPDDSLHAVGDVLVRKAAKARGRGPRPARDVLTVKGLRKELWNEFQCRAGALAALAELARPFGIQGEWDEAIVVLRNASDDDFREVLRRRLRNRPGSLTDLWGAVDSEPFHGLVDGPASCGATARAFGALLRTREPGRLGKYVWILTLAEVAPVGNLLQVEQKLLTALHALYLERDRVLTEGLPEHLFRALVLLYNADEALAAGEPFGPTGACENPGDESWRRAATCALLMQPDALPRLLEWEESEGPLVRPWAWRIVTD